MCVHVTFQLIFLLVSSEYAHMMNVKMDHVVISIVVLIMDINQVL